MANMNWKILMLTPEESIVPICISFGYTMLCRERWVDTTYGDYSPECHFDTGIEHIYANGVIGTVASIYHLDDENISIILCRCIAYKKDNPDYVKEQLKNYGITDYSKSYADNVFKNLFKENTEEKN